MLTDADREIWQEHRRILKFAAACRRQWPGATIALRPDGSPQGAGKPSDPEPAPGLKTMTDDFDTPTEADLESCYGSKYLATADVGTQRIRTRIARVGMDLMQPKDGKPPRKKFILYFTTIDKPMVLNATNKTILVDSLGRDPKSWVNTEVGVLVEPTTFAGKPTKGLRLRVLNNPISTAPKPQVNKPAEAVAKPAADPGFDDPLDEVFTAIDSEAA